MAPTPPHANLWEALWFDPDSSATTRNELQLGIKVLQDANRATLASPAESFPRQQFLCAPFAFRAEQAYFAQQLTPSNGVVRLEPTTIELRTEHLAAGSDTTATGSRAVAMGAGSQAIGPVSTALGSSTKASGGSSTAMGLRTTASGQSTTALGMDTTASGWSAVAMGEGSQAIGDNSTALGSSTKASGGSSTAMGLRTTASGQSTTALGTDTTASGSSAVAMGAGSQAIGDNSTALGSSTKASGGSSTAMGIYSKATGSYSTAMGSTTTASGEASIAMGYGTTASGLRSLASGDTSTASGSRATAVGFRAKASHDGTFVWGDNQDADFASTAANQFLIRASGGVGINTNSPGSGLNVHGTIRGTDVKVGSQGYPAVAGTDTSSPVRVVRGRKWDGTASTNSPAGGFKIERYTESDKLIDGVFWVTFSPAFSEIPIVVATSHRTGNGVVAIACLSQLSTNRVLVTICTHDGYLANAGFDFVAMGPR